MELLCCFKGRRNIGLVRREHGEDDARPNAGKRADGDAMTFPFCAFALVIRFGPRFLLRALPGKRMQGIAQGFDTPQATVWPGVGATLEQDRRGPTQSLQTGRTLIPAGIIADFCKQPWGQALSSSRQTAEDLVVFMAQKKALDLLIVDSNLLKQGQELSNQSQHQARLGARRHIIGRQMRLMQRFTDGGSRRSRSGMSGLFQGLGQLLMRGFHGFLWGGIGLQEKQGGFLLELGKKVQRDGIVVHAPGGELIHQSCLHLDQAVLIAGQRFQFGHLLALGGEPMQIREIGPSCFGEQIGINGIRFGS